MQKASILHFGLNGLAKRTLPQFPERSSVAQQRQRVLAKFFGRTVTPKKASANMVTIRSPNDRTHRPEGKLN